ARHLIPKNPLGGTGTEGIQNQKLVAEPTAREILGGLLQLFKGDAMKKGPPKFTVNIFTHKVIGAGVLQIDAEALGGENLKEVQMRKGRGIHSLASLQTADC